MGQHRCLPHIASVVTGRRYSRDSDSRQRHQHDVRPAASTRKHVVEVPLGHPATQLNGPDDAFPSPRRWRRRLPARPSSVSPARELIRISPSAFHRLDPQSFPNQACPTQGHPDLMGYHHSSTSSSGQRISRPQSRGHMIRSPRSEPGGTSSSQSCAAVAMSNPAAPAHASEYYGARLRHRRIL